MSELGVHCAEKGSAKPHDESRLWLTRLRTVAGERVDYLDGSNSKATWVHAPSSARFCLSG
jgi:hypothetical protein